MFDSEKTPELKGFIKIVTKGELADQYIDPAIIHRIEIPLDDGGTLWVESPERVSFLGNSLAVDLSIMGAHGHQSQGVMTPVVGNSWRAVILPIAPREDG